MPEPAAAAEASVDRPVAAGTTEGGPAEEQLRSESVTAVLEAQLAESQAEQSRLQAVVAKLEVELAGLKQPTSAAEQPLEPNEGPQSAMAAARRTAAAAREEAEAALAVVRAGRAARGASARPDQFSEFQQTIDRTDSYCVKYNLCPAGVLPMWVADMDLPVCQAVLSAIQARATHPCFGYTIQPTELWAAVARWLEEEHGWRVGADEFVFTGNLVSATVNGLHAFTQPGDAIALISPLYTPLQQAITGSGRRLIVAAAAPDSPDSQMALDMTNLRAALVAEHVKALIWCSPHNPYGRVWTRAELLAVASLCKELGVFIIADEIHSDLTLWGQRHVPMALVCQQVEYDDLMTASSPGKTWNLAGLHSGFVVLQNPVHRKKYLSVVEHTYAHFGSTFATVGMVAAYQNGREWRDRVCRYFESQIQFTEAFCKERLPEIRVVRPQASFLVFLNCAGLGLDATCGGEKSELCVFMLEKARVKLSDGWSFGGAPTAHYQRINVACPRAMLVEALERIELAVIAHVRKST